MNTHQTAIISCLGIVGIIIALVFGKRNNDTKYYLRQSTNALICTTIISVIIVVSAILMRSTISIIILGVGIMYDIAIFTQILYTAFYLNRNKILGIVEFL